MVYLKDGDQLLQLLSDERDQLDSIELILMDYNMPKLKAPEVLMELKKMNINQDFPIVIFSNSSNYSDIQHCYELGVNAYVVKPIDYDASEDRICKVLNFWLRRVPVKA